ncbi:uncharacterized protein LOC125825493 [Solanum verrucosum]|uniref:uncharacterized protein LOC125825493 n=1 Tax=Solanum verrucosum TaxID=315347 RepID=UPI0020D0D3EF|nr:uncharacterized protein LOC125825493 [Solanum verrucosum]
MAAEPLVAHLRPPDKILEGHTVNTGSIRIVSTNGEKSYLNVIKDSNLTNGGNSNSRNDDLEKTTNNYLGRSNPNQSDKENSDPKQNVRLRKGDDEVTMCINTSQLVNVADNDDIQNYEETPEHENQSQPQHQTKLIGAISVSDSKIEEENNLKASLEDHTGKLTNAQISNNMSTKDKDIAGPSKAVHNYGSEPGRKEDKGKNKVVEKTNQKPYVPNNTTLQVSNNFKTFKPNNNPSKKVDTKNTNDNHQPAHKGPIQPKPKATVNPAPPHPNIPHSLTTNLFF